MEMFPLTMRCLERIENTYVRMGEDYSVYKSSTPEDRAIFVFPMVHLAEALCMDQPEWEKELAEYLAFMIKKE